MKYCYICERHINPIRGHSRYLYNISDYNMNLKTLRKAVNVIAAIAIAIAAVAFTSCSGKTEAIDRMVKELNSPQFKAKEVETGLFTDSSAKLEGDTLTLTFLCRPALNLTAVTPDKLPALRESALQEFKAYLADRNFKEGMEALYKNDMMLQLVWQDTAGKTVKVDLPPAEILSSSSKGS